MIVYVGIDNGVSGTIGWITADGSQWCISRTITFQYKDHHKKKGAVNRINRAGTARFITEAARANKEKISSIRVFMERPFTGRFVNTTILNQRAYEAYLIVFEDLGVPYRVIDSKTWQKELLPGVKSSPRLKAASKSLAVQLFGLDVLDGLTKEHDCDGLLIAEWARRVKA